MAVRRVYFVGSFEKNVLEKEINFKWYSGLSIVQKQKSIESLHQTISDELNIPKEKILEISSKSLIDLGRELSAFNLKINLKNKDYYVENVFQSSKMFEYGGPYIDLLDKSPIEAKKDLRLKNSGSLVSFKLNNELWDLEPKTLFYDWIYLNALKQNSEFIEELMDYKCFTDIEFNHNKSYNCQAISVALFCFLYKNNLLEHVFHSKNDYLNFIKSKF